MKDVGFSWIFITKPPTKKTTVTDEEVECDATMAKMNFGFLLCKLPRYLHPPKTKHGTRFSLNLKESTLFYFVLLIFSTFQMPSLDFLVAIFPKTPSFFKVQKSKTSVVQEIHPLTPKSMQSTPEARTSFHPMR